MAARAFEFSGHSLILIILISLQVLSRLWSPDFSESRVARKCLDHSFSRFESSSSVVDIVLYLFSRILLTGFKLVFGSKSLY